MGQTKINSYDIGDGQITHNDVATANKDGVAATPSLRTLGTGAQQAAAGNHTHSSPLPSHSILPDLDADDHTHYLLADGSRALATFANSQHTHQNAAGGGGLMASSITGGQFATTLLPEASANRYFKVGTTNYTALYGAGATTSVTLGTRALAANTLYAIPFIAPSRGATVDTLEVYITTGVSGSIRIGIYENVSETGLYPGSLLLDAGAGSCTTSSTKITLTSLNQALVPGKLYWFVLVSDVNPTIRAISNNASQTILGIADSANTACTSFLTATLTYGALPSTAPTAGAAATAGNVPGIFIGFSA